MDRDAAVDQGARSFVWRRSMALASVEGPDRVVLLDLDHVDQPARILESTSAAIWRAINGRNDDAAIVSAVATAFGLEEDLIRDDVLRFLHELRTAHLVDAEPLAGAAA